ncbi:type II 3-dehydroquinate dehydratase [Hyphobacterium sp. HN65]|uniref:3-dehydroquinate dehydratase n=1 Tax=Hyphobacterium lacteum TaxID=3116575 RepID=A0ABU7LLK5_9PROT|nr:type II 3-dehydroquinate dehydratase [Hyphobacterium sp. HN65]MEE2524811.1 type II 3-dehydroquinate dehydratase [Hyphobacterium sp. HN65]
MSSTLMILNGPNLNLLGTREPEIYGHETLADIESLCAKAAAEHGLSIDFRQSNHEGVLIDWIQEARNGFAAIIINPAAYTHTSIALHDALKTVSIPVIEVHISDPEKREAFRHQSYVGLVANRTISGKGAAGYAEAVAIAAKLI